MKGSEWKSARLLAALLDRPIYHPRKDIPAWQEVILRAEETLKQT